MDNWEDWDDEENYCLPNEEQLKALEERKLVEQSDNALTKSLFDKDEDINKYTITITVSKKKEEKRKYFSNKDTNEKKQKEFSKFTKEQKAKKEKERELFGEVAENKYLVYEEMFY
jgi:hypothetical protein